MDDEVRRVVFETWQCPLCDKKVSHAHALNDGEVGALVTSLLSDNLRLMAEIAHLKRVLAMVGRGN